MNRELKKIYDIYKSPEAKQVVEYVWDVYDNEYSMDRVIEIIKALADNVEYLILKKERTKRIGVGMNKKEFIELTGTDPEDMFGEDWENQLAAYSVCEKPEVTI